MAIRLPRFQQLADLVDDYGRPTISFHQWWDAVASAIEENTASLEASVTDLTEALSYIQDIPSATISADYTGTPESDQLPRTIMMHRYTSTTENTASATWGFTVDSGGLTASFVNPGEFVITAIVASSVVTVTAELDGITKSKTFNIDLDIADPPTYAGGTASDTSFVQINSASHAAISNELIIDIGSSGDATLVANLQVYGTVSGANGTFEVFGKWQWWDGAVWQDVDTEVASNPDWFRSGSTYNVGALNVTQTQSALTPGNSEKFRFMARNSSGTEPINFSGKVTATSA